jgi:hypothetical protein
VRDPSEHPYGLWVTSVVGFLFIIAFGWPLLIVVRGNLPSDWPILAQALAYGAVMAGVIQVGLLAARRFIRFFAPR